MGAKMRQVNLIRRRGVLEERDTATTRRWTAQSIGRYGEDRVDVLLCCRSERNRACLCPIGLALSHLPEDVQLRGVREASGLEARVCCRATRVSMISGSTTDPGRHLIERAYQVLEITDPIP